MRLRLRRLWPRRDAKFSTIAVDNFPGHWCKVNAHCQNGARMATDSALRRWVDGVVVATPMGGWEVVVAPRETTVITAEGGEESERNQWGRTVEVAIA